MDCRRLAAGVDWCNTLPLRGRVAVARVALDDLARRLRQTFARTEPRFVATRWIEPRALHRGVQRRISVHLGVACGVVSRCSTGLGVDLGIVGTQKSTHPAALDRRDAGVNGRCGFVVACTRRKCCKFARRTSRSRFESVVDKLRQTKPQTFGQLERRGSHRAHDVARGGVARAHRHHRTD